MKNITLFLILILGLLVFGCKKDNTEPEPLPNTFTDSRDGQSYKWVQLNDGQVWMAENLNYETANSWCYEDKESNCREYGRLYNWTTALTACPEGWHLPSAGEWTAMIDHYGGYIGGATSNGEEAYSALIKGGSSGFDALLGGYRFSGDNYSTLGIYGPYWSATADVNDFVVGFGFRKVPGNLFQEFYYEGDGYSCRCVQD